jgi:hypothetical protein
MPSTDDELDPATSPGLLGPHFHSPIQNLLFPRAKSQVFMPLTSPFRRNSSFKNLARPEVAQHRSQALLDRSRTPAQQWFSYRKPEEEIKAIKNKKVREFYNNQVSPRPSKTNCRTALSTTSN